MESIILVKSVEKKHKGKGNWLEVTDEKGWKHNIFLKDKFPLINDSVGKHLKLTIEKGDDDQYWNTTDVEEVDATEAVKSPSKSYNDEDTRRSIERQVSAKIACEFFNTEGIGVALTTAERIYQWIASPSNATQTKPKKPKPVVEKTIKAEDVVEEWGKIGNEEERDFKDAGAFMAACYGEKGYDNAKVEEILDMPLDKVTNFSVAWTLVVNHKE